VSALPPDSVVYRHLWSTPELRALFDDAGRTQRWLDVLAALAEAQAELGLVPRGAVEAIRKHADVGLLDLERVAEGTRATGHSTPQAGLAAAAAWLRPPYQVVGVTVSRPGPECRERVRRIGDEAAALLGTPMQEGAPCVVEGFLGPAKGARSPEGDRAAELVARTEGVFLDPVFGAKAMAGLLYAVRAGHVQGPVVFLVTGGAPTLFTA
jgi:D-cysteine desulfhydrase